MELDANGADADQAAQFVIRRDGAFEIGVHRVVIHFDGGLNQLLAVLFSLLLKVSRNVDDIPSGSKRFVMPDQPLHFDQLDDALEIALSTDRELRGERNRTETRLDHLKAAVEVSADLVHLVAENHARD